MHEVFEAIGQPRNYELTTEEEQYKESRQDEKRMGDDGSPSLWDNGQGQEEQKPEDSAWVGSRAAHRQCGTVRTDKHKDGNLPYDCKLQKSREQKSGTARNPNRIQEGHIVGEKWSLFTCRMSELGVKGEISPPP